ILVGVAGAGVADHGELQRVFLVGQRHVLRKEPAPEHQAQGNDRELQTSAAHDDYTFQGIAFGRTSTTRFARESSKMRCFCTKRYSMSFGSCGSCFKTSGGTVESGCFSGYGAFAF